MSLEQQVSNTITRWLAAAQVREGVPTWQVSLGYMAGHTYYHASEINGFSGNESDWLRHLVESVPDEPFVGLRRKLLAQLDAGSLSVSTAAQQATAPTSAATQPGKTATPPAPSTGASTAIAAEDNLDDWLDSL